LQARDVATVPPNLTPFTPAVSEPGAQYFFKSLASTDFATQAWVAAAIVQKGADATPTLVRNRIV